MVATSLSGLTAVVTGAGSGIGRSIAAKLASDGVQVCLAGRTLAKLKPLAGALARADISVHTVACDLNQDDDVRALASAVERLFRQVDILVHGAGTIALAPLESTAIADFDRQYRVNVRAPLLLTQALLPLVKRARGQIVFINSSLGVRVKERAGAYAASKHALKALADTLRAEVQASGVRVLSVFPGNTATAMQQQVCRALNQPFVPAAMLQPDDVATAVVHALLLPPNAALTELHLLPAQPR